MTVTRIFFKMQFSNAIITETAIDYSAADYLSVKDILRHDFPFPPSCGVFSDILRFAHTEALNNDRMHGE
jgi:hypothetical protein